ncbi:inositol-tetrakisphosphate 1-kinase, partial [Poecilia latipinna]|uniref:inositol-tetrakisphosphate 1-kinase n=1 Tax=Poecilia latipinna TaxID=48699 RepID=UPI00072E25A0
NEPRCFCFHLRFQDYIDAHPETIVLDPLPAIRTLLDRCKSYQLVHRIEKCMQDERICSPPFMVLNTECTPDVLEQIKLQGLTFPFICKTRVAHGTNSHEMAIIFSEEDLKDVKPPCVIQSFINHNAVLYKVFVVGDSYTVVERPSLKNFPAGPAGEKRLRSPETVHIHTERKSIFFNSHNVSKPESSSDLTSVGLCVSLFGVRTGAGKSLNSPSRRFLSVSLLPGYEGVPEFFNDLLSHISSVLQSQNPDLVPGGDQPKGLAVSGGGGGGGAGPQAPCCCCSSVRGKELQRLGCNSAVSPNFQQHCVSTIATKASSQ